MKPSAPLPPSRRFAAAAFTMLLGLGTVLAACGGGDERSAAEQEQAELAESGMITARATDTGLELSSATAHAGPINFRVVNAGTKPYGVRLKGTGAEVTNVQPGSTAALVVRLEPGSYDLVSLTGSGPQAVEGRNPARLVVIAR